MTVQEAACTAKIISPQWQQELVQLDLSCRIKQIAFSIISGAGVGIVTGGIILAMHASSSTLFAVAISLTTAGNVVTISAIGMIYRNDSSEATSKKKKALADQFRNNFEKKSLDEVLTTYGPGIFSDRSIVSDELFPQLQQQITDYLRLGEYKSGNDVFRLLQLENITFDNKTLISQEYNKYFKSIGEAELECWEKQLNVLLESVRILENQKITYLSLEESLRKKESDVTEQAETECQVHIEELKRKWLEWIGPHLPSASREDLE